MNKPTLYVLCGVAFSGKTTLAKKITEKMPINYISVDDIMAELKTRNNSQDKPLSNQEWEYVFDEAFYEITQNLKKGEDVLFDSSNQQKKSRDVLRELALNNGATTKIIYINTAKETVLLRKDKNLLEKRRQQPTEGHFNHILNTLEIPGKDEDVILYNPDENFIQWMKKTFKNFNSK